MAQRSSNKRLLCVLAGLFLAIGCWPLVAQFGPSMGFFLWLTNLAPLSLLVILLRSYGKSTLIVPVIVALLLGLAAVFSRSIGSIFNG